MGWEGDSHVSDSWRREKEQEEERVDGSGLADFEAQWTVPDEGWIMLSKHMQYSVCLFCHILDALDKYL